jgi:glycosyltransferase involved in cell wall biosynthesis
MRIALFSECYLPVMNGVVTSMQTLRETLRAWGHTVYIFAPGTPQPEDDPHIYRLPELPFPRHPYHFARPFPRLKIDFSDLGVDIIHCQHPFTVGRLGADTAKRFGIPMVYTAHSLYDLMVATAKSPLVRSMGQKAAVEMMRRFCARADYVIAPSQYARDSLRANGVRARFAVIPSGARLPETPPEAGSRIRRQLGLTQEMPLLLYVGRVAPEKRLDLLLEAAAELVARQLPPPAGSFRLAVVGDGQDREPMEALAADLGLRERVLFVGAQPHETIAEWYAAGDIFTLTSPYETQGLVVLEAMAAGLPCVTVNHGGGCELIEPGVSGLRVEFDASRFADALEALLRDPDRGRQMGEAGRARAAIHSPEAMAGSVLEIYEATRRLPWLAQSKSGLAKSPAELLRRKWKVKTRRDRRAKSGRVY